MTYEFAKYPDDEKKTFFEIVKNGSAFFFKYARLGGLKIAQYAGNIKFYCQQKIKDNIISINCK